jgi:hypothetical protein
MDERRSEPRFMCSDLVKVRIQDAAGTREVTANLEDISPSGACVQLEDAALAGADIEVICDKCRLKGKVSYCRFAALGYDVGIAFHKQSSWNRRRFAPKHLLEIPVNRHDGAA